MKKEHVSDVVNLKDLKPGYMNMIVSGCGTGKTYLILNKLFEQRPDLKPEDVIFVTSRATTRDQQGREAGAIRFYRKDIGKVRYWNGEEDNELCKGKITIMLYNNYIACLRGLRPKDEPALKKAKLIILDECHTIYTDNQIRGIQSLRDMLGLAIKLGSFTGQLYLSMTATADIFQYQKALGYEINFLNETPLFAYRAKQLICTEEKNLRRMAKRGEFQGKTIVLVSSYENALAVSELFPNPFIFVGRDHPAYDPESMEFVRKEIVEKKTIPANIDTLITTSTLREGFSLDECCGVRNIVSYLTDPTSVIQICGRARYSIDKLVVVYSWRRELAPFPNSYAAINHKKCKDYLYGNGGEDWIEEIAPIVEDGCANIKRITFESSQENKADFISYMNDNWLMPQDVNPEDPSAEKYRIKKEDWPPIIQLADECGVFKKGTQKRSKTACRLINIMRDELGYDIVTKRHSNKYTYKLLVGFNPREDKKEVDNVA